MWNHCTCAAVGVGSAQCIALTGGVTLVWTEAPLAVVIVAAGGGAPELPVIAPRARARLVFVPKEDEGEHTGSSLGIPTNC